MFKKDKILNYLRSPEDKNTVARILDRIETVNKGHEPQVSDFYDPYQQNLIIGALPGNLDVNMLWSGGYQGAERQRLIVFPAYMEPSMVDMRISYSKITANLKFQQLTHRDYMGAVLNLGIKREKIGDLLPVDNGCQIIVDSDIASYLEMNLQRIHRVKVAVKPMLPGELVLPEEKVIEVKATVPSLRLDAVSSAGFGVSRSDIVNSINAEKIKLNWGLCADAAQKIQTGDTISLRGKGRIKVEKVTGETRKGRIAIILKRFV